LLRDVAIPVVPKVVSETRLDTLGHIQTQNFAQTRTDTGLHIMPYIYINNYKTHEPVFTYDIEHCKEGPSLDVMKKNVSNCLEYEDEDFEKFFQRFQFEKSEKGFIVTQMGASENRGGDLSTNE
jgi:hypothetical protein